MPANGRWDLIRRLKVNASKFSFTWSVEEQESEERSKIFP